MEPDGDVVPLIIQNIGGTFDLVRAGVIFFYLQQSCPLSVRVKVEDHQLKPLGTRSLMQ